MRTPAAANAVQIAGNYTSRQQWTPNDGRTVARHTPGVKLNAGEERAHAKADPPRNLGVISQVAEWTPGTDRGHK